jgi:PKHD-type hydroxylase
MYIFTPKLQNNFLKCCWLDGAMSAEFCAKTIELFNHTSPVEAGVHQNQTMNEGIRKAKVTWIKYDSSLDWLFRALWEKVEAVNRERYNFQLTGFLEQLQLTLYPPGGHYLWHEDNMEPAFTTRKLSVVVQLSDPMNYEGGELVIFPNTRCPRTRGTISFFPSFVTHKVEPVKSGNRYSLVAWVTGEAFR